MNWTTLCAGLRIGGHRGAGDEAPENTFAAFELGAAAGVDYLEIDVQLTADGEPIVIHDEELDRTTTGHGPVATATLALIRTLDAGAWFGAWDSGLRVPTLEEVVRWAESRSTPGLVIEAKGAGSGRRIAETIAGSTRGERLAICSFDAGELRSAKTVARGVVAILILDRDEPDADPIERARSCGADGVNIPVAWLVPAAVRRLHAAGLFVAGGTANDSATLEAALRLGIDAVDSDLPTLAVEWRARRLGHPTGGPR